MCGHVIHRYAVCHCIVILVRLIWLNQEVAYLIGGEIYESVTGERLLHRAILCIETKSCTACSWCRVIESPPVLLSPPFEIESPTGDFVSKRNRLRVLKFSPQRFYFERGDNTMGVGPTQLHDTGSCAKNV